MTEQLQYITQDHDSKSHVDLCREACEAGVRWIQLRMKNATAEQFLSAAKECRRITREYGVKLIINDNIDIALHSEADGVHLGQDDLNTGSARSLVPEGFIIGGTANTLEQIIAHAENGVDYVGVGPFRFTNTKKNLSPVLGTEGYRTLLKELDARGIIVPVIAIGGIQLEDIPGILDTGVHGIAVSGLITNHPDKKELINQINKQLSYATT